MNQTHLHLLITHLPIFGSILGLFVLGYGFIVKSVETKIAAFYLFVLSAIGAGIAYVTGESAEETVENIQGVAEGAIGLHEDAALYSLISLIILGVASLVSIYVVRKNNSVSMLTSQVTLLLAIVSFGLVARTGYLGGKIRHTEISGNVMPANGVGGGDNSSEEDDD